MVFGFKFKSFMIQDFKDSIKTLNLQIYIDAVKKIIDVYFILDLDKALNKKSRFFLQNRLF